MRLSDLCEFIAVQVDPADYTNSVYVGLEHLAPGRLNRIDNGKGGDVRSAKYAFRPGDILYGKLRPYLDKAILVRDAGICTTELLVLRPKQDTDPRFLVSAVHSPSFVEHAVAGTTGVQHPRTSWDHIADFELLDFGSTEQRRIASVLWDLHDLIVANEAVVEAGIGLKRSAMHALFTRGPRGEAQKETEIGLIPEGWDLVALGDLGRIGNGCTPKKSVTAYWKSASYPWLTSAKVYDRTIIEADEFVSDVALAECHLPRVSPGSVLVAITGQGRTLGHCAVLAIEATINQHLAYIAVDRSLAIPEFVRDYLETQYDYLRQVGAGGGSTKGALTCGFLRGMKMPLPPLEEQQEIITILGAIDRKIDLHRRKRAVLDELFKTFLHKLMTGEIRVADLDLSVFDPPAATEKAA